MQYTSLYCLKSGIMDIMLKYPQWGVRKVWALLRQPAYGMRVSTRRVWKLMRDLRQAFRNDNSESNQASKRVVVDDSNQRWATDFTKVWTKEDGQVTIVPTIDCGCRTLVAVEVVKSQTSESILASVDAALKKEFGDATNLRRALELRTDQGSQYVSQTCKDWAEKWNLNHTLAKKGTPTENAVVERVIRTMKEECIWPRDWNNAEELRQALNKWHQEYNEIRPHQALNWSTPKQRREENLARAQGGHKKI